MSRKPTARLDYTSRDYLAYKEMMLEHLKKTMPEYTDTSESDAGIVILEALANGLDIISMYSDIVANDILLPTTQSRRLATIISKTLGYTPYSQSASVYPQVFELNSPINSNLVIPKGTKIHTKSSESVASQYFETMNDLIIPAGSLGNEKDENGNYKYTVRVQAGESINEDVIGTSSGTPVQSFVCNYSNVLTDTLRVYVDEGTGDKLWEKVDSFLDADENSMVYTVSVDDFDVCHINFGNGIKGKIPTAYPNGIVAYYKVGGGESSNVPTGSITELDTGIPYVDKTYNLDIEECGHDKESLESIKQNASASFRVRNRLVTLKDYEDSLRMEFLDFIDFKAIQDARINRLVHIFYFLKEGRKVDDELLAEISEYITQRQMVDTYFDINPCVMEPVNITANLYISKDYKGVDLSQSITDYLKNVTFKYGNMIFGDSIVKSDLEQEIKATFSGVLSFRISVPTADIIFPSAGQNILSLGNVIINTITI